MTTQEYILGLTFLAFVIFMIGGLSLAIFWPRKKSDDSKPTDS